MRRKQQEFERSKSLENLEKKKQDNLKALDEGRRKQLEISIKKKSEDRKKEMENSFRRSKSMTTTELEKQLSSPSKKSGSSWLSTSKPK